jgi:monodehydroascorbate reductase (NADH)
MHEVSPARLPGFHTSVGSGGEAQDAAWYERHGIKVLHGGAAACVTVADLAARRLATALGRVVRYDHLVVATGSEAVRLPAAIGGALPGVHYIRREADVAALLGALRPGARVVVVGGGYIGMEVAAGLAPRGVHVTMARARVCVRVCAAARAAAAAEARRAPISLRCSQRRT